MTFHLMCVHLMFSSVWFAEWPAFVFRFLFVLRVSYKMYVIKLRLSLAFDITICIITLIPILENRMMDCHGTMHFRIVQTVLVLDNIFLIYRVPMNNLRPMRYYPGGVVHGRKD